MATKQVYTVDRMPPLPDMVDIPETREYESAANARLDEALCDSVEAAVEAEHDWFARVHGLHLGSHYLETR